MQVRPASMLDIGAGAGKYGKIAREIMGTASSTTALEIDEEYIKTFSLATIYDVVLSGSSDQLIKDPSLRYDFVVLGDVLEHMRKSDGIDLLNFLYYRTSYIFIVLPADFEQDAVDGHAAEAHISVWSETDFASLRIIDQRESRADPRQRWKLHLFILEGLQARNLPSERRLRSKITPPAPHKSFHLFGRRSRGA